jgi:hypothetical protein
MLVDTRSLSSGAHTRDPLALPSLRFCARGLTQLLPQALPAQAILAIDRHRQARGFLGAPARSRRAAGEFRAAAGTGEAARTRIV